MRRAWTLRALLARLVPRLSDARLRHLERELAAHPSSTALARVDAERARIGDGPWLPARVPQTRGRSLFHAVIAELHQLDRLLEGTIYYRFPGGALRRVDIEWIS